MTQRKIPVTNEELRRLYEGGLSSGELARIYAVRTCSIYSALIRAGTQMRTTAESKEVRRKQGRPIEPTRFWLGKKQPPEMVEKRVAPIRGKNHYLWKGGKERRPYRDKVEKEQCAKCGGKLNLGIHHIDFDHYHNAPENLQVLCLSCHMSLHKQAYWDAIHEGREPPKSTGPNHWRRKEEEENDGSSE